MVLLGGEQLCLQLAAAKEYLAKDAMMETELQDFFFFFGNAKTSRDPLVRKESDK